VAQNRREMLFSFDEIKWRRAGIGGQIPAEGRPADPKGGSGAILVPTPGLLLCAPFPVTADSRRRAG
jgi:hypothetical protein